MWFVNHKQFVYHQYTPTTSLTETPQIMVNDTSLSSIPFQHLAFWKATTFFLTFNLSNNPSITWGENMTIRVAENTWQSVSTNGSWPILYNNYTVTIPLGSSFNAPVIQDQVTDQVTDQVRAEYTNVAWWVIFAVMYIVCILVIPFVGTRQPMKSRGAVPVLTCLTELGILIGGVQLFLNFEQQIAFNNNFNVVKYPFQISQCFVVCMGYLRCVTIVNAKMRKAILASNKDNTEVLSMPISMIILKRLGHWSMNVLIYIIVYIPIQCIYILVHFTESHSCLQYLQSG
jgi:hypothetical protein